MKAPPSANLPAGFASSAGPAALRRSKSLAVFAVVEQGFPESEVRGGESLVEGNRLVVGVDGLGRVPQRLIRLSDEQLQHGELGRPRAGELLVDQGARCRETPLRGFFQTGKANLGPWVNGILGQDQLEFLASFRATLQGSTEQVVGKQVRRTSGDDRAQRAHGGGQLVLGQASKAEDELALDGRFVGEQLVDVTRLGIGDGREGADLTGAAGQLGI